MSALDLTDEEQTHVRAGLHFLRARFGGWTTLGKALKFKQTTLGNVANGHKPVSASMAVRIARLVSVRVDDVLSGKFPPPGTCAHCGHRMEAET